MDKQSLLKIISHNWFYPVIILLYAFLYITYGEKLPANSGLGWDGARYAKMLADPLNTNNIDSYYVFRLFLPLSLHYIFEFLSLEFSAQNIIKAFEIVNVCAMAIGFLFINKSLDLLKVSFHKKHLAFWLVCVTYFFSKFLFYYPVLTDASAFLLMSLLLYFYLKDELIGKIITTLIAAFTFPVIFYQGLLMLLFPRTNDVHKPIKSWFKITISSLSALYLIGICVYYFYAEPQFQPMALTLPISKSLLPVSIYFLVILFYFFPYPIFNRTFFEIDFLKKQLLSPRILIVVGLFTLVFLISKRLNVNNIQSGYFGANHFLKAPFHYASVRPLISLVTHFSYFGVIIVLLLFFWKRFSLELSKYGLGIVLAFLLNIYLIGIMSESRIITNLMPIIVVFLIKAINDLSFSRSFYYSLIIINLIASKFWLKIDYSLTGGVNNPDGTIGFPNQKFFMNLGPWISSDMWLVHGLAFLLSVFIIGFLLYKNKLIHLRTV